MEDQDYFPEKKTEEDWLEIKKREVIQMQYFGGMSQKEIAAVLHITPENVRVLAYRAKKDLKRYLEEFEKEQISGEGKKRYVATESDKNRVGREEEMR